MKFITGYDRHQMLFEAPDMQVSLENPGWLINAFEDKLDMSKLGFTATVHKSKGRPPYTPNVHLKLYLYGKLWENKIGAGLVQTPIAQDCCR